MSNSLPNTLYTCEQTRELDRICIEEYGVLGIVLMKRAARAAFQQALKLWPEVNDTKTWIVLCGSGNNAGDGYIFAALAEQKRQKVKVYYLKDPEQLTGDAYTAYCYAKKEGVAIEAFNRTKLGLAVDCIFVDAMLGTGLKGNVQKDYEAAIQCVNELPQPVFSLDIPSGLCGDTGAVKGAAVSATATITFIACKVGLLTGGGITKTGQLFFSDLALPEAVFSELNSKVERVDLASFDAPSSRQLDAHKGRFGHVMVIGGDHGYGGAAIMAAEAAAFTGTGMVSLATREPHVAPALVRRPEIMAIGVESGQSLEPLLKRPSVLVVGTGLGLSPWSEQMLQQSINSGLPLVIDADGLTILANKKLKVTSNQGVVLTPHPGEAARLLSCSVADIQKDRVSAIKKIQREYGGIVLLKGAGTLIYNGETLMVANVGNPGLATAGSGDVLSGIIGACIAQGMTPFIATQYAACLHGAAADRAANDLGEKGMQASEITPYVRELMR